MTVLAAPLVIAAHADRLPTLPGWATDGDRAAVAVYEGAAARRDDVREYVTLGYVAGLDDAAVTLEPVPNAQGTNHEAGSVACQLIVAAVDVPTARARTFDLIGSWAGWLVDDRTLGGRVMPGSDARLSVDVALATTRSGATANALVTVQYAATTYG